jgi:hypothetical protein
MAAVTLSSVLVHLYIRGQLTPLTREDGHSCGHARILLEVDSAACHGKSHADQKSWGGLGLLDRRRFGIALRFEIGLAV